MRRVGSGSVASGFSRAGSIVDRSARTGRGGLIEWVNSTLELRLVFSGPAAKRGSVLPAVGSLPSSVVSMQKVNFAAQFEHEFMPNYKQLQGGLDAAHIDK
ncbi:hypothetical protein WJX84_010857, partial [Apatococcus fuscideae]